MRVRRRARVTSEACPDQRLLDTGCGWHDHCPGLVAEGCPGLGVCVAELGLDGWVNRRGQRLAAAAARAVQPPANGLQSCGGVNQHVEAWT